VNAINLKEQYNLLSLWRLTEDGQWELVEFARPSTAIYRCRHDAEGSLYAFLPSFRLANKYGGKQYEHYADVKPRQAASHRHNAQPRRK